MELVRKLWYIGLGGGQELETLTFWSEKSALPYVFVCYFDQNIHLQIIKIYLQLLASDLLNIGS